jgi:hypothetical protein
MLAAALLALAAGVAAAGDLNGVEVVRGKDSRAGTIQLGDRTFAVTAETVIRLPDGTPITLEDLDVPDFALGQSDPMLGIRIGRYEADDDGHPLLLRSLDLVQMAD